MSKAAGYAVRLSPDRQRIFEDLAELRDFAEAVPEFAHSRNVPLVCFVVSGDNLITHVCLGSRGRVAGTSLRRLNMRGFHEINRAIPVAHIAERISSRSKRKVSATLHSGGLLSPKAFEELVVAVCDLAPDTALILAKYRKERLERIASLPDPVRHALAQQKEALLTAMSIAGIDRTQIQGWDLQEQTDAVSFLSGLADVRLREDQVIGSDLSVLPGHEQIKSAIHGSTVFENAQSRLTVVLANRLPLEKQTGADLIYFNETFKCFLLVQYKMMEREGDDYVFRFPNAQLTEEISRMEDLLSKISQVPDDLQVDGFRFSNNPFFLKVCPRIVFDPDNVGLSIGMYLPLDYWKRLSTHPALLGPRGGNRLSYRNVRRYFDNTEFLAIASGGWVGTNIPQSTMLIEVIRTTIQSGRAAVIAINQELDDRNRCQDSG